MSGYREVPHAWLQIRGSDLARERGLVPDSKAITLCLATKKGLMYGPEKDLVPDTIRIISSLVTSGRMHNVLVLSLSAYGSNVLSVIVRNLHHKAP